MTRELHHIIPRCMGGSDDPSNLVLISARAHAILSVYQSEHYGRPCIHHGQLKYLPPLLYDRGKHWVKESAKAGSKALFDKHPKRSVELHGIYKTKFKSELEYRREQSRRASLSSMGRYKITNGVSDKLISESEAIPDGWVRGSHIKRYYYINNGVINKAIPPSEPIPAGWSRGRVKKT